MTRLYFENRKAVGKGILVFNPEEPGKSKYMTVNELDNDIAVAQEFKDTRIEELFKKISKTIESKGNSDLALVAMVQDDELTIHLIDPEEANKKIDEYSNGIIF
jgi:hypothetical protein